MRTIRSAHSEVIVLAMLLTAVSIIILAALLSEQSAAAGGTRENRTFCSIRPFTRPYAVHTFSVRQETHRV
jgi:hypothetical protein